MAKKVELYIGTDDGMWDTEVITIPTNTEEKDILEVATEQLNGKYVFTGIYNYDPCADEESE